MDKNQLPDQKTENLDNNLDSDRSTTLINTVSAAASRKTRNLRYIFAEKCEQSFVATLLDRLYNVFLFCPVRLIAVFLSAFSVSSLLINYFLVFKSFDFLLNSSSVATISMLIIGAIMFTTRKTVGELLTESKVLSQLSVVYSQNAIISFDDKKTSERTHSTPLFVGIICGILTVIFPAGSIVLFLSALIYTVFIINRPECGLALAMCSFGFMSSEFILMITVMTFIALLYKFMRGKRHISFGVMQAIMVLTVVYILLRAYFTLSGQRSLVDATSYISFILVCILTTSLITATGILNRVIKLIITISRCYTVIFICYGVCSAIFGLTKVKMFLDGFYLSGIVTSITQMAFFAPFLLLVIPLNFACLLTSKNIAFAVKNAVSLSLMILSTLLVNNFWYLLTAIFSCVIVLFFYKKRTLLLAFAAPFLALGLQKLYNLIPAAYKVNGLLTNTLSSNNTLLMKNNFFFGIGIGRDNYEICSAGIENPSFVNGSIYDILTKIGIVGIILMLLIIAYMIIGNINFVLNYDPTRSIKVRINSAAIVASTLSFVTCCFFMNCIYDFRIIFLFALIMSLGYCHGKCINADYVDETMVREYK